MSFKVKGFDKLQKDLKHMEQRAKNLGDGVGFLEMFTDNFMSANTKYPDAVSFFDAFGQPWETNEAFEAIPEDELDAFVAANSKFKNWEEMLGEAVSRYIGF